MKIGWIGTGVMGESMCRNLMKAGHSMTVWTRTKSKAQDLIDAGAKWCDSAAEVTAASEVICTMVGYPADLEAVVYQKTGVMSSIKAGQTLIDFTTSKPELARRIANDAADKQAVSLDAPVSGGDIGAANGTLSIMVGGDKATFEKLADFWTCISKTLVWQGEAGAGQQTKLTNQILVASSMIGVCEALLFAKQAGLNLATVLQSVSSGAAGSWALTNLGPRIIEQDYAAGFYVEHFVKDLGIVLEECKRMKISLPGAAHAYKMYEQLRDSGGGKEGTQAVIQTVAAESQLQW